MKEKLYDLIVIGSGPGGEGAAMKAAKAGKKVAVVEKHALIGGNCAHTATIPSKVLRFSVQLLGRFRSNPLFQSAVEKIQISYPDLLKRAESVISKQVQMRQTFYQRNNVEVIHGLASFVDANHIKVTSKSSGTRTFRAHSFVIATGSTPYHPTNIDFTHKRALDSDSVLSLQETPSSIAIYGAGVIGCEYASILQSLGITVHLINTRDRLLSFLDDEITDALGYHLRDQGVCIHHNESYHKVELTDTQAILWLKSGKKIKADYLLWCNGRSGNTDALGLDKIGIPINRRQQIDTNEYYQTCLPHIYAVGDVIGYPSLASASFDQGRFAATHLIEGKCKYKLQSIPTGIYTSPEISSIGQTEQELTAANVPYEIGYSAFKSLARSQIENCDVGMLKILFHRETLEILGVHCFGSQASEIIHIGQLVMNLKDRQNSLMAFINTTFNYPTTAEAYRVAALNGLNRL
ncbi:MAG: Si-specific NAD(P)(+) transhydrogenase [Bacteriovoracaceae bacterium]|nr:Si-specific NAD(P)(+) transhydrogenase [Bacteriovoracaceae bacterium]